MRETIIPVQVGDSRSFAVVSAPTGTETAPVTAVLMSPGALRKTGQHRMWTELARRWAARGVVCVRFDLPSVGDATGPGDLGAEAVEAEIESVTAGALCSPTSVMAISQLLIDLREAGAGDRFVTIGHCSGAYLGFHSALREPSVVGYFGVDQQTFTYSEAAYQGQMLEMIGDALRHGLIQRLRERGVTRHELMQIRQAVAFRLRSLFRRPSVALDLATATPDQLLGRLDEQSVDTLLLLVEDAELYAGMPAGGDPAILSARWPHLRVEELPTEDHMARALWLQRLTHDRLDAGLERLLDRVNPPAVASTPV